jgi:hypothetical protein
MGNISIRSEYNAHSTFRWEYKMPASSVRVLRLYLGLMEEVRVRFWQIKRMTQGDKAIYLCLGKAFRNSAYFRSALSALGCINDQAS